jgi:hypothetical protein
MLETDVKKFLHPGSKANLQLKKWKNQKPWQTNLWTKK